MNNKKEINYMAIGSSHNMMENKYECKKEWDDNCKIQCGTNKFHMVESLPVYYNAFFEVFIDDDYIRGEGETLEIAEENAFKKLEKMKKCVNHTYKEIENTRNLKCTKCYHVLANSIKPKTVCDVCKKAHSGLQFQNKKYCIAHFIEKIESLLKMTKEEQTDEFEKRKLEVKLTALTEGSYVETAFFELDSAVLKLKIIKLMLKFNVMEKDVEEYIFIDKLKEIILSYESSLDFWKIVYGFMREVIPMVIEEDKKSYEAFDMEEFLSKNDLSVDMCAKLFKENKLLTSFSKMFDVPLKSVMLEYHGVEEDVKLEELINNIKDDMKLFANKEI